jgi:fibro-slime domain-containing protein
LAIDLGGVHPSLTGSIDLDARAAALGITKGQVYRLELFHAERHTSASHFHIDTTLAFVDCGVIPPDIN